MAKFADEDEIVRIANDTIVSTSSPGMTDSLIFVLISMVWPPLSFREIFHEPSRLHTGCMPELFG